MISPTDLEPGPDDAAWDLFVFHKSRELLPTRRLVDDLRAEIQTCAGGSLTDALVRAGEIETGLADTDSPATGAMINVVDQLAATACNGASASGVRSSLVAALEQLRDYPLEIRCAHPEGFSYYGLHPLDFADLAANVHSHLKPRVAVIGIRSVGSALGAVVVAALRAHGILAERITVRAAGEPYDRHIAFTPAQQRWIQEELRQEADFVIVDEGPGFSGSTFLSVARGLRAAGVPESNIALLCSRPFPAHLVNTESGGEWRRFRSYRIEYGRRVPHAAGSSIGGGAWRDVLFTDRARWPACWTDQERIKHLSEDGKTFFKFEGFGRYGHCARQQATVLALAGFSPPLNKCDNGYAGYEFVRGRPLSQRDLTSALLERMAAYCVFRASSFPAGHANTALIADMLRVNLSVELGVHDFALEIPIERPVYPDCRMVPHEWLLTSRGELLKTDSVGHGEGHQLPGPADITWDLAGTIVEWQLPTAAADHFLRIYRRQSGDNPGARLPAYLLLYSVLRMAQCRMAAAAMVGSFDAGLLHSYYRYLRSRVKELLQDRTLASGRVLRLQ
ncbi:MAG TPA: hypothetical protein VKE93_15705 [Candidatus Angelobacter sp.]|nr:hypothetical protein [Candidatus Angelobacter sp.]